ncbi:integral inner nuclear membrane protein Ima1 [Schizosaccharomyces japonicus yFS275]|uniref:Integral inner nuclear membrane protein Ima1 n=1 Tax=Schizosaccharomyces japonicus (strain yFS275 / FY16936) TaxID=402676 RepID=B6K4D5_SCHJY|nr:integral inner nuclear membrane protein Ima1 [Schizosaccharomyces japonicus yFS275]EEB08342.1 integral inner nuclear membrane protein Ima1 [Schizosaccharomyces japonicus yFS275]
MKSSGILFRFTDVMKRTSHTRVQLRCFYCNKKAKINAVLPVREWTCPLCEATNRLDENGEIVDYVPPLTSELNETDPGNDNETKTNEINSPFCWKCQRNQQLYIQAMASYLPESSHPDYAAYEAAFPQYKESLLRRFPIVCKKCEKPVEEQIAKNNYRAKYQTLGYWLKTSKNLLQKEPLRTTSIAAKTLWMARGCGFVLFHIYLFCWFYSHSFFPLYLGLSPASRFPKLFCSATIRKTVLFSIFLVFWNPFWLKCQRDPSLKLVGQAQYICCQFFVYVFRLVLLYGCFYEDGSPRFPLPENAIPSLYTLTLVLNFLFLLLCMSCLKLQSPPTIRLSEKSSSGSSLKTAKTQTVPKSSSKTSESVLLSDALPSVEMSPMESLVHQMATVVPAPAQEMLDTAPGKTHAHETSLITSEAKSRPVNPFHPNKDIDMPDYKNKQRQPDLRELNEVEKMFAASLDFSNDPVEVKQVKRVLHYKQLQHSKWTYLVLLTSFVVPLTLQFTYSTWYRSLYLRLLFFCPLLLFVVLSLMQLLRFCIRKMT